MAAKLQFLAVAAVACLALAANVSPSTSDPEAVKDVADAFVEALKEEQPLLTEEIKTEGLHKSVVKAHLGASKDDLLAALMNPGGWATEFEKDVTDLVIGLSKGGFGATPFGNSVKKISDIIKNEMMPQVINFHTKDQNDLNRLYEEWKACDVTKTKSLGTANARKVNYLKASKHHKNCRGQEAALYTENVECHEEWLSRKKEKELKCKAYAEVSKKYGDSNANKQIMIKQASENVITYVTRFTTIICGQPVKCPTCKNGSGGNSGGRGGYCVGGFLDTLICHKNKCEVATKRYNEQTKKCKDLDQKWHDRRKSCNTIQDTMDGASCKWALETKDACETYAECWKVKKESFEERVCNKWALPDKKGNCTQGVEADEHQRHPEWKGLQRMDCIIQAFGSGGGITMADITRCKGITHETKKAGKMGVNMTTNGLVIAYPTPLKLIPCLVEPLYPNTAEYKAAEFAPLPTLAKGKAGANDCMGVGVASTTPAKEAQSHASAKR